MVAIKAVLAYLEGLLGYYFQQCFHISNSRKVWFFFLTFYASAGILLITENTINVNQVMNRYFQLKIDVPICIIQECFRKESMAMVQFSYYILCEANQYVGYQKPLSKIDWLFTPLLSLPVFFPKHCKLIDFLKVSGAGGLEAID